MKLITPKRRTASDGEVRRRLLRWFGAQRKAYPWRENPTPYSVWISEVMLQQTVTTAVVPYFERWLQRFPDLLSLAAATERQVLRAWEGLGYYSRARNLHRAARKVVNELGGRIPDNFEALVTLPGIGNYTAAAIMSIAFNKPYPVVDANVRRVVSRLLAGKKPDAIDDKRIYHFLATEISRRRPGPFNEALMELGQTLCRVRTPKCGECPLATSCGAFRSGVADRMPKPRVIPKIWGSATTLIISQNSLILLQQSQSERFRNMWGLPRIEKKDGEDDQTDHWLLKNLGLRGRVACEMAPVTHLYTRYAVELWPTVVYLSGRTKLADDLRWFSLKAIEGLPMIAIDRRIVSGYRELLPSMHSGKVKRLIARETQRRSK